MVIEEVIQCPVCQELFETETSLHVWAGIPSLITECPMCGHEVVVNGDEEE